MSTDPNETSMTPETAPSDSAQAPETAPAETPAETAPAPAEAAAPEAAPAPAPASPKPVRRPPIRQPGTIPGELAKLITLFYNDFDLKAGPFEGGALLLEVWQLPADLKGQPAPAGDKGKWPARGDVSRAPDFKVLAHYGRVTDPSFGVPAKELSWIVKDRKSAVLLLLKDERGYLILSDRIGELSQTFPLAADGSLKITGPKLRKGGVARFFSMNGCNGELNTAVNRSR